MALGELRDPRGRAVLAGMTEEDDPLASTVKRAIAELEQQTPVVADEVVKLREEVRELQKTQQELRKSLDEMKSRSAAKSPRKQSDQQNAEGDEKDKAKK